MLAQNSLVKEVQKLMLNEFRYALAQGLGAQSNVLGAECSQNDEFEGVKEERYRLREKKKLIR